MNRDLFRSAWRLLLSAVAGLAWTACGVTEPDASPIQVEGVWQSTTAGLLETTIELAGDGTAVVAEADLASSTCEMASGRWTLEADDVVVRIATIGGVPSSTQRRFGVGPNGLETFRRVGRMTTCVDYGWGEWSGTVSVAVDGVTRDFSGLDVDLDIAGGSLRIVGLGRTCDTCPLDTPQLVVELDAESGPLTTGSYTVQNVAGAVRTLYGFYHPDPGNPTFLGFNTTRLSPPGEFVLDDVGFDRVIGTFEFRANPLSDGQAAPDGSETTLITDGEVRLTYR